MDLIGLGYQADPTTDDAVSENRVERFQSFRSDSPTGRGCRSTGFGRIAVADPRSGVGVTEVRQCHLVFGGCRAGVRVAAITASHTVVRDQSR